MVKEFEKDIAACLPLLESDGIILYPTDTIWGLGCDAGNQLAVQRIISLKQRPVNKSFVVLVADETQLQQCVGALDPALLHYIRQTNRPTTVIYPHATAFAPEVYGPDGSIAIRICHEPFCQELLGLLKRPILSTSANISGQPAPGNFPEVQSIVRDGVDYMVTYRQADTLKSTPSTIIKWTGQNGGSNSNPIEIIRP